MTVRHAKGSRSGAEFDEIATWALTHLRELLTRYAPGTKLDGAGRGPCPIHGGDGPNFSIAEGKGWHCFTGCNAGGDGVDLVRRLTGRAEGTAGRVEVLRELAPLAGVSLTSSATPYRATSRRPVAAPAAPKGPPPPPTPLEELRAEGAHVADATEIHTAILHELTLGPRGAAYLASRGFVPEAAAAYGFRSLESRGEWEALEAFLAENYLPEERTPAGVGTVPSYVGGALVIPYRSSDGAGFVGWRVRSLEPDCPKERRYLSLKGYALPLPFNGDALTGCAGHELHVVEGELNAYTLSLYGLRTIGLAGAGTWRTEWTEALRSAGRVVAWYDKDKAGDKGRAKLAAMLADVCGSAWVKAHGRYVTLAGQDVNDRHHAGTLAAIISNAGWRT